MTDAPAFTLFLVPPSSRTVRSDCGAAFVAWSPTLGAHRSMGVPCALNSAHKTALIAVGHALTNRSVSRAFLIWP
jgi:hypothetical protein